MIPTQPKHREIMKYGSEISQNYSQNGGNFKTPAIQSAAIYLAAISFSKICSIHNENQGKQTLFPRSTNPCVNWSLGWQNNHSSPKVEDGLSYEGVCSTWREGHTQQINRILNYQLTCKVIPEMIQTTLRQSPSKALICLLFGEVQCFLHGVLAAPASHLLWHL